MHHQNRRSKNLVLLATCLLAAGCATKAEQVTIPTPQEWEVAHEPVRAGKSAYKPVETSRLLNSHSMTGMGLTLTRTTFMIDEAALQRILDVVKETDAEFSTDVDSDHAFGPESNRTWGNDSEAPGFLPWWQPWEEQAATWYAWAMDKPRMLTVRVFLQVCQGNKNEKLVYMRVESG